MYYFDFLNKIIIVIYQEGKDEKGVILLFLKVQKPVFIFQTTNGKEFYLDPKTNTVTNREIAFANFEGLKSTSKQQVYIEQLKENSSKQTHKVQTNTFENQNAMYLFNKLTLETLDYKDNDIFKFTIGSKNDYKSLKRTNNDDDNNITGLFSLLLKNLSKLFCLRKYEEIDEEETELEVDVDSGNMSENKDKKRKKKWFVFA